MLGAAPVKRPNILFVMTDDQVPQTMGCYGSTVLSTPNFDRLAREGVRFTNCFVTNSLCAPSRASVLTGAYSHINGIRGNSEAAKVRAKMITWPDAQHAFVVTRHTASDADVERALYAIDDFLVELGLLSKGR